MVVRIKTKNRYQGTATPSTLNEEVDVINLGDQDDDYIAEGFIDLSQLEGEDKVVIKVYVAVDGANRKVSDYKELSGAQGVPVIRFPACTIHYNGKLRVTITQTAGTLRSFPYSFIVQIMEEI